VLAALRRRDVPGRAVLGALAALERAGVVRRTCVAVPPPPPPPPPLLQGGKREAGGSAPRGAHAAVVAARFGRREDLPPSASPRPPTTTGADEDARRAPAARRPPIEPRLIWRRRRRGPKVLQRRRRAPAPRRRKHPVVAAAAAARQGRRAPTPRTLRPPTSPFARGETRIAGTAPPSLQRGSDDRKTSPRRRHRARRRRRGQTKTRGARRRHECRVLLKGPVTRSQYPSAPLLRPRRRRFATMSPATHAARDDDHAHFRDRLGCQSRISIRPGRAVRLNPGGSTKATSATADTHHELDRVVDALVGPAPLHLPRPVGEAPRARRARVPMNPTRTAWLPTPGPKTSAACSLVEMAREPGVVLYRR